MLKRITEVFIQKVVAIAVLCLLHNSSIAAMKNQSSSESSSEDALSLSNPKRRSPLATFFKGGQRFFVSAFPDGSVRVWPFPQQELAQKLGTYSPLSGAIEYVQTFYGHADLISCIHVVQSKIVITGSCDSTVKVWDINTGDCMLTFYEHKSTIVSVVYLNNGWVKSRSEDGVTFMWDIETHCSEMNYELFSETFSVVMGGEGKEEEAKLCG